MQRCTVFISSTVKDFAPVRRDLREWLQHRGLDVRASEDPDFPVDHGVTSHDACLRAIEASHLVIVLIGERAGGDYAGTAKSITWREYDEALARKIPTIVLVLKEVNTLAEQWGRGALDRDRPPFGKDTERVVAFIDHVRKGHVDNWFHSTWDGSFHGARQIIQSRVNALLARLIVPYRGVRDRLERMGEYAAAQLTLHKAGDQLGFFPEANVRAGLFLATVEHFRGALLGFVDPDVRWNIAVYAPDATGQLAVFARVLDPRIPRRDRPWQIGEGHVGLAWQKAETLVAADLRVTSAWANPLDGDGDNYLSAVAEPIFINGACSFLLVVTSSQIDHFRDGTSIDVLTVRSLALQLKRHLETP